MMVTHDPRAAKRAKRLLRLIDGSIVSENPDAAQTIEEDEEDRDAA